MAFNKEELVISFEKYQIMYDKANKELHRKDVR